MKRLIAPVLLLALTFSITAQGKPIITVLDFNVSGLSMQEMRGIIGYLSSALFKTGRYNVIDVTQRDTLLKEMEFSASGCSDEACQLKIGKMLTAAMIVVGDITKLGSRYLLTARMLETETANTISTADGKYASLDELVDDLTDLGKRLVGISGSMETAVSKPAGMGEQPGPANLTQLKIALLVPLSGPVPTFGVSTRDGALLAIKEWNAKGGVLGRRIQPIVEDTQCTSDPALNAAKRVIDQEQVHYIIGEVCSKASIPISEYANSRKVIQISPTSTNPAVTVDPAGKTKEYIFRACFTDEIQGKIGAKFALQKGAKTAFLMFDQSNGYVRVLSEAFEKGFVEGGGKIMGKYRYGANDKDFSEILDRIKQTAPDIVYLPDYYNIVNLVTRQARAKGITTPFLGGDGWDSSDLDTRSADGGFFTNHFSPADQRAEVRSFLSSYAAGYKGAVPDALATLAYDAVNMLLQAIKDTAADDPVRVKDTLARISFNAVSGRITFDKAHNPLKTVTIMAVKNGGTQFERLVNP